MYDIFKITQRDLCTSSKAVEEFVVIGDPKRKRGLKETLFLKEVNQGYPDKWDCSNQRTLYG